MTTFVAKPSIVRPAISAPLLLPVDMAMDPCWQALAVSHSPNPCEVNEPRGHVTPSFPYMWYYRTEVRNNLRYPIKILWFEGFRYIRRRWERANVLGRELTGEDFALWYGDGDPCPHGVIGPGQVAVCDPNWSGGHRPCRRPVKWAYLAADEEGTTYYTEALVFHASGE